MFRHGEGHERLDSFIKTDKEWDKLKKLRDITVGGIKNSAEDYVLIRPARKDTKSKWKTTIRDPDADETKRTVNPKNDWIARIVALTQDRSSDEQWAMIAWLYWPGDLKDAHGKDEKRRNGRKGYHGEHELIAFNHLDIVDVRTFDRNFADDMEICKEEDHRHITKEYYWRQTYDIRDGSLSVRNFFPNHTPLFKR